MTCAPARWSAAWCSRRRRELMSLLDALYDRSPARLFVIVLGVAVAANLVPFAAAFVFPRIVFATWVALALVWIVIMIAGFRAHGRRALWLVLTAPVAFLGPTAYMAVMIACTRTDSCP